MAVGDINVAHCLLRRSGKPRPYILNCQFFIVNCTLLIVNCQLSIVNFQLNHRNLRFRPDSGFHQGFS